MSVYGSILTLRSDYIDYYKKKDYFNALKAGEELIRLYRANKDMGSVSYAKDCFLVADVYFMLNNMLKCIELYREAARILMSAPNEGIALSNVLNNMAVSLSFNGQRETALKVMIKAMETRKRHLKEFDEGYFETLYNIGVCYYDLEDYDKALHYHMISLNNKKKRDLDYVDNLNFIGYDFEKKGDIKNAILYMEKSVQVIIKLLGKSSDEYFRNIYYLASLHEADDNYEEALLYYTEAAELLRKFLKSEHPYYAEALNRTANIYAKLNDNEKSLALRLEALNIIKGVVGENHIYYANSLRSVADIYKSGGNYEQAEKLYRNSIEIKKTLLGADNEDYIKDLFLLSDLYEEMNEFEKAYELLNDTLEILDEGHPFYVKCLYSLARISLNLEDPYGFYELYKRLSEAIGVDDEITLSSLPEDFGDLGNT